MSKSRGFPYAIWLVPSEDQRTHLRAQIRTLANQYGAPAFDPHATLCSGTSHEELPRLCDLVDSFCADVSPLSLDVNGIGHTDDYFSFLFLCLVANEGQTTFQRAAAEFPDAQLPGVGPHLSLMYSDLYHQIDRRGIIKAAHPTLPKRIAFDRMQIITPDPDDWRDVQKWEVRHSTRFGG